jgi:hypothetical protein
MQISSNTPIYQTIVNDKLEKNHQTSEAETSNCKKKEAEESTIAEANKVKGGDQAAPSEIRQSISVKV